MAAESGKIDPMHQFLIQPLAGQHWEIAGHNIAFTNSALWMAFTFLAVWAFMLGGMKRDLVPGRWQFASGPGPFRARVARNGVTAPHRAALSPPPAVLASSPVAAGQPR